MLTYAIVALLVIAIALVTALIRTKIWNRHKDIVTSGNMSKKDYKKEVEQFGIYTPKTGSDRKGE